LNRLQVWARNESRVVVFLLSLVGRCNDVVVRSAWLDSHGVHICHTDLDICLLEMVVGCILKEDIRNCILGDHGADRHLDALCVVPDLSVV